MTADIVPTKPEFFDGGSLMLRRCGYGGLCTPFDTRASAGLQNDVQLYLASALVRLLVCKIKFGSFLVAKSTELPQRFPVTTMFVITNYLE